MSSKLGWLALAGAALIAVSGLATFAVGVRSEETARGALEGAIELRRARLDLAASQEEMGRSDLSAAIEGAEKANASAERVAVLTNHIARMVTQAEILIRDVNTSSRASASSLGSTATQTDVVAGILGAISGYQGSAARSADITNAALERILRALRATNESFPGRDRRRELSR